jgi:twitching motility protein PilT
MDITELLTFAINNRASDLHLTAGQPPIFRIDGDMTPLKVPPLMPEQVKQLIYSVMNEQQRADYERDLELDFAISFGDNMRFRVNAFNTIYGAGAVLRNIPTQIKTLEELGTPDVLRKLANLHKGMLLVTGPTGSGKSTTLAAIVNHINTTMNKHILTIEDPVEFVHKSQKSLVNQREVGQNTKSFAKALKSALREDPDVILVGELRDLETIQLAITAAETGHLVMGTLHTSSAPKTIDRIIDVFPGDSKDMIRAMLSVSLEAVITQTLLKKADGKGRVAAHEILICTPPVRNLIREGKIPQIYSAMQVGSKVGMRLMKDAVYDLAQRGLITQEEARHAVITSAAEDDHNEEGSGSGNGSSNATRPTTRPSEATATPRTPEPAQSGQTGGISYTNKSYSEF